MESNLNRFGGMSIIVTGAASGIGKATVERFLSEGANVTALGHHRDGGRDQPQAGRTAECNG